MADKKWYVVHVYSGFERKIAEQIKQQAAQKGLADKFDEVLVPTEQVVEVRRGQKIDTDRKFFPGYVLVKMEMTDDAWHLVKDTPKVTGFLGARNKSNIVALSEGKAPVFAMRSRRDLASVAKTPGVKRCCRHVGSTGAGPYKRCSNQNRMYN